MKLIVRPSYEDIFPSQSITIEEALTNSNSDVLFDFISLVLYDYDKNCNAEKDQFDFIFNCLLNRLDRETVENIEKQIAKIKKKADIYFFYKYSCLYLLEYSIRLSKKTKFIDNGETGLNIFKAFLLVNSEITKKEDNCRKVVKVKKQQTDRILHCQNDALEFVYE